MSQCMTLTLGVSKYSDKSDRIEEGGNSRVSQNSKQK